jgi:hypothetical protein
MSNLKARSRLTPLELSQVTTLLEKAGLPPMSAVELLRIVRLPEATRLSGLSEDGLRRYHADKFVQLSPRAIGMRVIDALLIGAAKAA